MAAATQLKIHFLRDVMLCSWLCSFWCFRICCAFRNLGTTYPV